MNNCTTLFVVKIMEINLDLHTMNVAPLILMDIYFYFHEHLPQVIGEYPHRRRFLKIVWFIRYLS